MYDVFGGPRTLPEPNASFRISVHHKVPGEGLCPSFRRRKNSHCIRDLIFNLFSDVDPKKREMILDDRGKISLDLNIVLNGRIVSEPDRFDRHLREGDFVELILGSG